MRPPFNFSVQTLLKMAIYQGRNFPNFPLTCFPTILVLLPKCIQLEGILQMSHRVFTQRTCDMASLFMGY